MRDSAKYLERWRNESRRARVIEARAAGRLACAGLLALAGGAIAAPAQNKQATVSDAQVESSVLQALAKNPKLSGEQISSTTVYGTVTLSGQVPDEPTRALAEDVVARTAGVTKVIDELTLGATPPTNQEISTAPAAPDSQSAQPANGQVLQSDGTYAPATSAEQPSPQDQPLTSPSAAPVERSTPDVTSPSQPAYDSGTQANSEPDQPAYGQSDPGSSSASQAYPQSGPYGPPQTSPGQQTPYPQGQYGPVGPPPQPGQYGRPRGYTNAPGSYSGQSSSGAGQPGGVHVTVPAGTTIQLRVNQPIDSRHSPIGSSFSGVLQQDIVVGGFVALPRGASLQGTVVDASSAGPLRGRAELGLQLTELTLGGLTYPVSSNVWSQAGGDKAVRSVNSALGFGVLGAIIGGVAGGGAGAAIGAGAGGAAGLGASAASSGGAVVVPPESLLTFHLNAPMQITTVPQVELNRLAYNVPAPGYGPPRMVRRYPAYYPYGPGYYYPRYYRGYPY